MRALKLERPHPAGDRGRLLAAEDVALKFPEQARPTLSWVRQHVRPRVKVGRLVLFYEADVDQWIAKQREEA